MVEEHVFPRPAVAGALEKGFVEARLHTDGGPSKEENVRLQKEKVKSVATPIYVIVEPRTERTLRIHEGPPNEAELLEFLRGGKSE